MLKLFCVLDVCLIQSLGWGPIYKTALRKPESKILCRWRMSSFATWEKQRQWLLRSKKGTQWVKMSYFLQFVLLVWFKAHPSPWFDRQESVPLSGRFSEPKDVLAGGLIWGPTYWTRFLVVPKQILRIICAFHITAHAQISHTLSPRRKNCFVYVILIHFLLTCSVSTNLL